MLPSRIPSAAHHLDPMAWPSARMVRVARGWAIVGHLEAAHESMGPRGWYAAIVTALDGGRKDARIWWSGVAWGLRRRRDAVASARAAVEAAS